MTIGELILSLVGIGGGLVVAWLAWRAPTWAVALVVASVPLQGYARMGTEAAGITWTQAWLWSFLAAGAILFVSGALVVRIDLLTVLLALVVVCYAISLRQATDTGRWANELYRWGIALAFLVVARGLLARRSALVPLLIAGAVGGIWTGFVALAQVIVDVGPASFERAGVSRAYASFGEPNTFGAYAAAGALSLGVALVVGKRGWNPWLTGSCVAGCGLACAGLALSQSRGAVAATVAVVAMILLGKAMTAPPPLRVAAAGAVIAASLLIIPRGVDLVVGPEPAVEVSGASWAEQERRAHWGAAVAMVVETGGVGVGAGQFDVRYRERTPAWRFRIPQGHAHDAYLQVTAEAGLLGGIAYVSFIAALLATLARRLRRDRRSALSAVALAVTVGFAIHNLVDYLHVLNLPLVLIAWWAAALGQSEGSARTP